MTYLVDCEWLMQGTYRIKASSEDEALKKLQSTFDQFPALPVDHWLASPIKVVSIQEKHSS